MQRISKLFTKTTKETPKNEESINASLLIRGGFIYKNMAGVYTLLPLGLRVVNKINKIIREEINAIGGQELFMPALQNKELWQKTGRWTTDNDIMYQLKDNSDKDLGLGYTHEETITEIATHFIHSYKDLPKAVYQIQTKFRDEPRAKSGILRGREFMMKDLYSFHINAKDRDLYYDKVKDAYEKIFRRIGIGAVITYASGGTFSKYSHEFQTIADSGEDTIYLCKKCSQAVNKEIKEDYGDSCQDCGSPLEEKKSIEVGNIFKLGTKFSAALNLKVTAKNGETVPVEMASYGIGPTRVMGAIVEVSHDKKGIIWTKETAPYDCYLIEMTDPKAKTKKSFKNSELITAIEKMEKAGVEVLADDRVDVSGGEKLADADLIGCPWRVIISPKSLQLGGVELKNRKEDKTKILSLEQAIKAIIASKTSNS